MLAASLGKSPAAQGKLGLLKFKVVMKTSWIHKPWAPEEGWLYACPFHR